MTQQRRPRQPRPQFDLVADDQPLVVQKPMADVYPDPSATSPEPTPTGPVLRYPAALLKHLLGLRPAVTFVDAHVDGSDVVFTIQSPEAPAGAVELQVAYRRSSNPAPVTATRWITDEKAAS